MADLNQTRERRALAQKSTDPTVSTPITKKGMKKVKRGKKKVSVPKGKQMATKQIKKTIRSNKWTKVAYLIKPKHRAKVAAMTKVNAKRLFVKQVISLERIGKKKTRKNKKKQTVFHTYKVRVQG